MNDVNQSPIAAYKEEVSQYTKKDSIHALLFFAFIMLVATFSRFISFFPTGTGANIVYTAIQLGILFVILIKKGQGLRSVGIHLIDWKKALIVGLVLAIACIILFNGILMGLLGGWQLLPLGAVMQSILLFLFMAFYEDVFFAGYMQTRLYGLIKKDWMAIAAGAFMFVILHWPSWLSRAIDTGEYGVFIFMNFVWIVMYLLLNTIFRHTRSIISVTLFHFSNNLAIGHLGFGLWVNAQQDDAFYFLSVGICIILILLITKLILPYLNKRKAVKQKSD